MGKFEDELGRWHYTVETDTDYVVYEAAVYTEAAKRKVYDELAGKYGKSCVRWVPNPGKK